MSFINSSFPKLTLRAAGIQLGINSILNSANYKKREGKLVFCSPRGYENVYVYAAKRTMMQMSFATINDLYPKYLRQLDYDKAKDAYKKYQGKDFANIINNGKKADQSRMDNQKMSVRYMGKPANEALVIWIKGEDGNTTVDIEYKTYWDKIKMLSRTENSMYQLTGSNDILADTKLSVPTNDKNNVFLDLGAIVSMSGGNNIVQTKVQGRDFSRKELISGDDLVFTVKGKIVSNYPDIYPYEHVSRFVNLMKHKGVLQVHNLLFQQFNVTQIIVKDFNMGQIEGYKNVQPYSFTCVAVEVDNEVKVVKDTIEAANIVIEEKKKTGWEKAVLENIKKVAANQAAQMLEQLTSKVI